jgi:small subunit ribosomal protein S3
LKALIGREVLIEVQEIRKPDLVAQPAAENISLQLERRISFLRAMKKAAQSVMTLGADGIQIRCAVRRSRGRNFYTRGVCRSTR